LRVFVKRDRRRRHMGRRGRVASLDLKEREGGPSDHPEWWLVKRDEKKEIPQLPSKRSPASGDRRVEASQLSHFLLGDSKSHTRESNAAHHKKGKGTT